MPKIHNPGALYYYSLIKKAINSMKSLQYNTFLMFTQCQNSPKLLSLLEKLTPCSRENHWLVTTQKAPYNHDWVPGDRDSALSFHRLRYSALVSFSCLHLFMAKGKKKTTILQRFSSKYVINSF